MQRQLGFLDQLGGGDAVHHEGIDATQGNVLLEAGVIGADVDLLVRVVLAQQLFEVGTQVHRDRLAFQILETVDGAVALAHHYLGAVIDVGLGEGVLGLALVGDGDLVGDGIDATGFQHAEQAGEAGGDELDLVTGALTDLVPHVHLEALQLVLLDEGEREILAGHADLDGFLGDGLAGQAGQQNGGAGNQLDGGFHGDSSLCSSVFLVVITGWR